MYQNNPRIDRRIKLSTLSRENLPNDRIQDCIQSEYINETTIQITSVAPDGNALISHGGYKQNKTKRNNQAISGCKVLGNLNMYTKNKTRLTSWKQITALVVLAFIVWQFSFSLVYAQSDTATSQLVGYVFAGSTQQGRVVNVEVNLLDVDGELLAETTTSATGSYSFDVPAGSYIIENSVNGATLPTTVNDNIVMVGLDFYDGAPSNDNVSVGLQIGIPTTAQVVGYVFGGTNQNVRLVNTEVELLYPNGTAVLNGENQPVIATTNANGSYSFEVIAGTYLLRNMINGESLTVSVVDNIVMVGMDFYDASVPTTNVPLAVSLGNLGATVDTLGVVLIFAVAVLTIVTSQAIPKAYTQE